MKIHNYFFNLSILLLFLVSSLYGNEEYLKTCLELQKEYPRQFLMTPSGKHLIWKLSFNPADKALETLTQLIPIENEFEITSNVTEVQPDNLSEIDLSSDVTIDTSSDGSSSTSVIDLSSLNNSEIVSGKSYNQLLIKPLSPTGETIRNICTTLREIDKTPQPVSIEVLIVQMNLKNEYTWQNQLKQNLEKFASENNSGVFSVNQDTKPITAQEIFGGGVDFMLLKNNSLQYLFQANRTEENYKIISRPNIVTCDGKKGFFKWAQIIPYLSKRELLDYTLNLTYIRKVIENQLSVTPKICGNTMILNVQQLFTDIISYDPTTFALQTEQKSLHTQVSVPEGYTIALGGFMREITDKSRSSIPAFRKLPILDRFFSSNNNGKQKKALLYFITPKKLSTEDFSLGFPDSTQKSYSLPPDFSKGFSDKRTQSRYPKLKKYLQSLQAKLRLKKAGDKELQ